MEPATSGCVRIVLNRCYGGFSLSDEAKRLLHARNAQYITYSIPKQGRMESCTETPDGYLSDDFRITWGVDQGRRRTIPDLVAVVEELGDRASGPGAKLRIIEVPEGMDWVIHEFDGREQIRSREGKAASMPGMSAGQEAQSLAGISIQFGSD